MLTTDQREGLATSTRLLQTIIAALFAGLAAYLIVIVAVLPPPAEVGAQRMAPLAAGFAALQAVMAVVFPRVMEAQQRAAIVESSPSNSDAPTSDVGALLGGYQVRRIVAAAFLEGAGFFNGVAYQSERQTYSLGCAIAMLVGILMLFPLRSLVEQWLERELRTVQELRDLRG